MNWSELVLELLWWTGSPYYGGLSNQSSLSCLEGSQLGRNQLAAWYLWVHGYRNPTVFMQDLKTAAQDPAKLGWVILWVSVYKLRDENRGLSDVICIACTGLIPLSHILVGLQLSEQRWKSKTRLSQLTSGQPAPPCILKTSFLQHPPFIAGEFLHPRLYNCLSILPHLSSRWRVIEGIGSSSWSSITYYSVLPVVHMHRSSPMISEVQNSSHDLFLQTLELTVGHL